MLKLVSCDLCTYIIIIAGATESMLFNMCYQIGYQSHYLLLSSSAIDMLIIIIIIIYYQMDFHTLRVGLSVFVRTAGHCVRAVKSEEKVYTQIKQNKNKTSTFKKHILSGIYLILIKYFFK